MRSDRPESADDRSRWEAIDRDWRSVVVGAAIVALIALFELRVPW